MDIVLCVYLTPEHIHTAVIQKDSSSSVFEVRCRRSIPLLSMYYVDGEDEKYIFGFDATNFSDLIPGVTLLSTPSDFLRVPLDLSKFLL